MKIREVMSNAVHMLGRDASVREAALMMQREDIGSVPINDGDKLVGMVTDRDIEVRGVAQRGELKGMKLADVMSGHVRCAKEGDDVEQVLSEMAEAQIRRLPVVDANQCLVGIVTLGDIAAKNPAGDEMEVAASLGDISSPAEPDRSESGQSQSQSQTQH
jgi:CBS domain-containing protein